MTDIAHIIQAEASTCGIIGMLAVWFVFQRNPTFYGYAEQTSLEAWWVVLHAEEYSDPTKQSHYLVSLQDLEKPEVREYTSERSPPNSIFLCAGGLALLAYPLREEPLTGEALAEAWKNVVVYRYDDIPQRKVSW